MYFSRGYYEKEEKFFPDIEKIEEIYDILLKFPQRDKMQFFSIEEHNEIAEKGNLTEASMYLFSDAFNLLKFFFYTNIYKPTNITKGLIQAYNSQNYLVWIILSRSLLEYSAIFHYYKKKIDELNIQSTSIKFSELQEFEKILLKFVHGTRFNWQSLTQGKIEELPKESSENYTSAVNVLTAIEHLKKRDSRFKDVKFAYDMLSDFSHPNMASHTTVVEMPESEEKSCIVNINPSNLRGEFIMIATIPTVQLSLGNILEMIQSTGQLIKFWLERIDSSEQIEIDFNA